MPRMGTFLPFRMLSSCFFKSAKLSKIEEGVRTLGDNMVRVLGTNTQRCGYGWSLIGSNSIFKFFFRKLHKFKNKSVYFKFVLGLSRKITWHSRLCSAITKYSFFFKIFVIQFSLPVV